MFVLAFSPFKNSGQVTKYCIGVEKHPRTGLGTHYLLLIWHRFGHTETVNQAATLSHTLSIPLTSCNTMATRANFRNRELNLEQLSRCTSSLASTCRRPFPRHLETSRKTSILPDIPKIRRSPPDKFPNTTTRRYRIGEEASDTLERRTTCR